MKDNDFKLLKTDVIPDPYFNDYVVQCVFSHKGWNYIRSYTLGVPRNIHEFHALVSSGYSPEANIKDFTGGLSLEDLKYKLLAEFKEYIHKKDNNEQNY